MKFITWLALILAVISLWFSYEAFTKVGGEVKLIERYEQMKKDLDKMREDMSKLLKKGGEVLEKKSQ